MAYIKIDKSSEDYVHYLKRTGGQVSQFYSLSINEEASAGHYRTTEVVFSKESYRRVVLTTKLFPIGIAPDSISSSLVSSDDLYFKPRISPITSDNMKTSVSFIGGLFKNIRKTADGEDKLRASTVLTGGEFRAPLVTYRPAPEHIRSGLRLVEGVFRKMLVRTSLEESISSSATLSGVLKSTKNEHDVLEFNFKTLALPLESNKGTVETFGSVIHSEGIRFLSRSSGLSFLSHSNNDFFYGKASLGIDFKLRQLGGTLFYANAPIRFNPSRPSQIEVGDFVSGDIIQKDTWHSLVLEQDDDKGRIFLDGVLLWEGVSSYLRDTLNHNLYYIGNAYNKLSGILGHIRKVYIVRGANVVTEGKPISSTSEIVAIDTQEVGNREVLIPDITILPANNYKIEVVAEGRATSLITDGQYRLSIDKDLRVVFSYFSTSLTSYATLLPNKENTITVYKIRKYLILVVNSEYDSSATYPYRREAELNPLSIGGAVKSLKMTNFYKDEGLFDKYYQEHLSSTIVLNFEEGLKDEGSKYREWEGVISTGGKWGEGCITSAITTSQDPGLNYGDSDYTFEAWIYGAGTLLESASVKVAYDGNLSYAVKRGGKFEDFLVTNAPPSNTWSHIALVRTGGVLKAYINGSLAGSAHLPPSLDLSRGLSLGNSGIKMDSIRLVKEAVYLEDFEVPDKPVGVEVEAVLLYLTYKHLAKPEHIVTGTSAIKRCSIVPLEYATSRESSTVRYTEGSFTYKLRFRLSGTEGALMTSVPYFYSLEVRDKRIAFYRGSERISDETEQIIQDNTWYVLTCVKQDDLFLVFIDGVLVLQAKDMLQPFQGGTDNIRTDFVGEVADRYLSGRAEYFDTHLLDEVYFHQQRILTNRGTFNGSSISLDPPYSIRLLINVPQKDTSLFSTPHELAIARGKLLLDGVELMDAPSSIHEFLFAAENTSYTLYMDKTQIATGALKTPLRLYCNPNHLLSCFLSEGLEGFLNTYKPARYPKIDPIVKDTHNIVPAGKSVETEARAYNLSMYGAAPYGAEQVIENFPVLPPNFSISFWSYLEARGGTLMEGGGIALGVSSEGLLEANIALNERLSLHEWTHIKLSYVDGVFRVFKNGALVGIEKKELVRGPSSLVIGRGIQGAIDHFKIERTSDIPLQGSNPLEEIWKEAPPLHYSFPNLDLRYGGMLWQGAKIEGQALAGECVAFYRADISRFLLDNKKMWISYIQEGRASCKVTLKSSVGNTEVVVRELALEEVDWYSYRYIVENMCLDIDYIDLEFSLQAGARVHDIKISFEDFTSVLVQDPVGVVPAPLVNSYEEKADYGYIIGG